MRFLIYIFCILKLSHGLTLNCSFESYNTVYDRKYSCIVNNFQTSFKDRVVTDVIGNHYNSKTHSDVKQVFIKYQNVPYLPLNLGEFFLNLETLYVTKSNLQHLMVGDLDGLDKLKLFDVSHNPVEHLGVDYFKGHSSIEKISFYDCHLKKVDNGALDPLTNLKGLYFDQNPCIDVRFDADDFYGRNNIEEYIYDIYDKCNGMRHTLRSNLSDICHPIKSEKIILKTDDIAKTTSSMWSIGLISLLALTMLLNIIFGILLVKVFKNNFNSNWHEMKSVLI